MRSYPINRPEPEPDTGWSLIFLYLFLIVAILILVVAYVRATDKIEILQQEVETLETHCGRPHEPINRPRP